MKILSIVLALSAGFLGDCRCGRESQRKGTGVPRDGDLSSGSHGTPSRSKSRRRRQSSHDGVLSARGVRIREARRRRLQDAEDAGLLHFSASGKYLLLGSRDTDVFDLVGGRYLYQIVGAVPYDAGEADASGEMLAVCGHKRVFVVGIRGGLLRATPPYEVLTPGTVRFDHRGLHLAYLRLWRDGLQVLNLARGTVRELDPIDLMNDQWGIWYLKDDAHVAMISTIGRTSHSRWITLVILSIRTGKEVFRYRLPTRGTRLAGLDCGTGRGLLQCAWSYYRRSGLSVMTVTREGGAFVARTRTILRGRVFGAGPVSVSEDRPRICLSERRGMIGVYDVESGRKLILTPKLPKCTEDPDICECALDRAGRTLAASGGGDVWLWDVDNKHLIAHLAPGRFRNRVDRRPPPIVVPVPRPRGRLGIGDRPLVGDFWVH